MNPETIPADRKVIPRRARAAHKGDHGRILLIGGSYGMHGAVALAAAAAFRSGAGLVRIALPRSIYPLVGILEPRATYLPLVDDEGALGPRAVAALELAIAQHDVIAIGPGLGDSRATQQFVQQLVPRVRQPLVLDADGLNAFAGIPASIAGAASPRILTPHPGELRRLTGIPPGDDPAARRTAAVDLAMRTASTVILKGHRSVITDGMATFENETGNPGMATGGSGDVLTGCLAALFVVLRDPLQTARVGAFAHGLAGDLAAEDLGEIGLTASDLPAFLSRALALLVEDP